MSTVYADKAYNDYKMEDELKQRGIDLLPLRKQNSKRIRPKEEELDIKRKRKTIETAFSSIVRLIPRKIHAVTSNGFIKKILCFVLAYCSNFYQVAT